MGFQMREEIDEALVHFNVRDIPKVNRPREERVVIQENEGVIPLTLEHARPRKKTKRMLEYQKEEQSKGIRRRTENEENSDPNHKKRKNQKR